MKRLKSLAILIVLYFWSENDLQSRLAIQSVILWMYVILADNDLI